ncbi:hypothetical protein [Terrimonas pollutisoli]|uniref:hypothetical protein n=1 Tax=Terrimonas pollutisoli TaxID=3034147 RepID=UPI0023EDAC65|nr:hypothetical protein [Terrimonas sp. H1YJ31]
MNHFISVPEAAAMTSRYRNQKETILKSEYQGQNILCQSETFDRLAFDTVLGKTGCQALRIYYGMAEDLKIHAIIVGVDGQNADILPGANATSTLTEDDDAVFDRGIRCPDLCPDSSPLNT